MFDLLFARAFDPLTPEQQAELDALSAQSPDIDFDCYDRAAAAIDLHCRAGKVQALPEHLKQRILAQAPLSSRGPSHATTAPARDRLRVLAWSGWIAAAAALVVALAVWKSRDTVPATPSLADQRARFVAEATDALSVAWKPTDDPNGKNVSGDLVWSPSRQQGFMRFRGLPANVAERAQYQLWIFDKPRGTDQPVDGGVFDVGSNTSEWIVPIHAKLKVFEPTLFAVTEELPGGVVVSKREHVVALASL